VFASLGWSSVIEMAIFAGLVTVGLVYAWRTGVLSWT
jgi:NADH-quinone oxidoreductase subunit A